MAVASPAKTLTPLEKWQAAFPDLHQKRNGWWANDDNPRFDLLELPNGDIRIHSWTGRSIDTILGMGKSKLTRADLYAKGVVSQVQERDKLDLPTLAQYMKIDWRFLLNIGYSDGYSYEYRDGGKVTCVKLGGYCNPDGSEYSKQKVRVALHGKSRFYWNTGSPGEPIPCGLHRLDLARSAGYLVIGEGESDAATCWFHDIPYLGISGSSTVERLDVDLLAGISAVYIVEEPDQAKKLQDTGQGFYKDVRKHLRANGYTGAIFSIRFEDATGYKDPSDLHKAIYSECKEQEESPFWADVHTRFMQVIEAALSTAIPEGNESLREVQAAQAELDLEQWLSQVITVKSDVLSDRDIRIAIYLKLYMRRVERQDEGWLIDPDKMALDLDIPKESILERIRYMAAKVGLFIKRTLSRKIYLGEEVRHKGKDVYLTPTYSFKKPNDACIQAPLQDQHISGGPREKSEPAPTCVNCGESTLDTYHLQHCRSCGYDHFKEVDVAPPTFAPAIESTAAILPLTDEVELEEEKPETPNLPLSDKESNRNPQIDPFGNVQMHSSTFPSEWTQNAPCEHCGCPLSNGHGCVRCYPPADYRPYKDMVNTLYPKKAKVAATAPPEMRVNHARMDGGLWEVTR